MAEEKVLHHDDYSAAGFEGAEKDPQYLLVVKNLKKYFPIKSSFFKMTVGNVKAVDGVSFKIKRGTTMGLVGESGCGKSTIGRTILRLQEKTDGEVYFNGTEIFSLSKDELRKIRPQIQIIFQDPYSSLSPRLPVGEIIGEAVRSTTSCPPRNALSQSHPGHGGLRPGGVPQVPLSPRVLRRPAAENLHRSRPGLKP